MHQAYSFCAVQLYSLCQDAGSQLYIEGSIQGIPVGFDSDGILWISDPSDPKNIVYGKILSKAETLSH